MNMKDIREKAKGLGMKNFSKMKKGDLIRAIQVAEGNSPCFEQITDCRQYDCCWMGDCQV